MNRRKKVRSACIAAVITALMLPAMPAMAQETAVAPAGAPSGWAVRDVELAQLHELAAPGLFGQYQTAVTKSELQAAGTTLLKKLSGKADAALGEPQSGSGEETATREDAAVLMYKVIRTSHPELNVTLSQSVYKSDTAAYPQAEAASYISSKAIIQGMTEGGLSLAEPLSREQLLTIVKRTYEFVLQETNTASKGLVWKISGGKSPVYVMGSIHIADISIYPLDNIVEQAYGQSDHLAVEADIVQDQAGITYMGQKAVYTDGSTLDKHVSPETYRLLSDTMGQFGYGPEVYSALKPWYAALIIQNLKLAESSYSADFGLDYHFLSDAEENGKSVLEVEGIKFQVDMFDSFTPELQEQFLLSTLIGDADNGGQTEDEQGKALGEMLGYWKAGDASKFGEIITAATGDETGDSEFNRIFWEERNKHMYETIGQYLADPGGDSYFVIVGAGHLLGDKGVLKQLEQAGYKVEQLLD